MAVDRVERAAGRVSGGFVQMVVLVMWLTQSSAAFLEVAMDRRIQVGFWNDNVTINCKISGSSQLDIRIMGVTWLKKSQVNGTEVKVFELFGSHQQAFRSGAVVSPLNLMKGDASLLLPGVQLREAGEYRCEVVITPEKAQGTTWLQIVAYPVTRATVKNNEEKHILCKSSGFYPKEINVTWNMCAQEDHQCVEVSEGTITGPPVGNEDGTFNVTSHLRLKPSLRYSVTVYQCVVRHSSLSTPQRYNVTLPETESQESSSLWIIFCVVAIGLSFPLCWCFWKRFQVSRCHRCRQMTLPVDNDAY